mmetsp:Transcript_11325/g.31853  ORF Transcript_11325/g.31853 Transcript_11325/m.31853 type:complete len:215 (+) Transcript_11325:419-1063(+)
MRLRGMGAQRLGLCSAAALPRLHTADQGPHLLVAAREGCLAGLRLHARGLHGAGCRRQRPVQARPSIRRLLLQPLLQLQTLQLTSKLLQASLARRGLLGEQQRGLLLHDLAHAGLGVAHLREAALDVGADLGLVSCESGFSVLCHACGSLGDAMLHFLQLGGSCLELCLGLFPRLLQGFLQLFRECLVLRSGIAKPLAELCTQLCSLRAQLPSH